MRSLLSAWAPIGRCINRGSASESAFAAKSFAAAEKRDIYGCAIVPPDYLSSITPSYETIRIEMAGGVGTITIARPKQLNALNSDVS